MNIDKRPQQERFTRKKEDTVKKVELDTKTEVSQTSTRSKKTVSYNIDTNTLEKLNQLKKYWIRQDIDNYSQYTIGYTIHKIVKLSTQMIKDNKHNPDYLVSLFAIRGRTNLKPKSFFLTNREEFETDLSNARELLKQYTDIELDKTKAVSSFISAIHKSIIMNDKL